VLKPNDRFRKLIPSLILPLSGGGNNVPQASPSPCKGEGLGGGQRS